MTQPGHCKQVIQVPHAFACIARGSSHRWILRDAITKHRRDDGFDGDR